MNLIREKSIIIEETRKEAFTALEKALEDEKEATKAEVESTKKLGEITKQKQIIVEESKVLQEKIDLSLEKIQDLIKLRDEIDTFFKVVPQVKGVSIFLDNLIKIYRDEGLTEPLMKIPLIENTLFTCYLVNTSNDDYVIKNLSKSPILIITTAEVLKPHTPTKIILLWKGQFTKEEIRLIEGSFKVIGKG